jgi:sigma-E factor negative regulatory protein RseC
MKTPSTLEHPGIVSKIEDGTILVDIEVASACSACHAKGYCTAFGKSDKIIEIPSSRYPEIQSGDKVNVIIRESLGMQALLLGYILPVIVLILTLFSIYAISGNDGLAALSSLVAVAVYYIIIYKLKDKIRKHFTFSLEKM